MRKRAVLFILAVFLLIPSIASAVPFSQIIGLPQVLGDKYFTMFSFESSSVTASDVDVSFFIETDGSYNVQFASGLFSAENGSNRDVTIKYTAEVFTGPQLITSIDQHATLGALGTGGHVQIDESVWSAGFGLGSLLATSSIGRTVTIIDPNDPPAELTDILVFSQPQGKVWVTKDLGFVANVGGTASGTTITQSFHQTAVPEPATLLLLGFGLIGLAGASRKFKK